MSALGTPSDECDRDPFAGLAAVLARPDVLILIANVAAGRLTPSAVPTNLVSVVAPVANAVRAVAYRTLLKEKEAAEQLNVSVKTLQNHRSLNRGIKPVYPLGKEVRLVRYDPLCVAAAMLPDDGNTLDHGQAGDA